MVRRLLFVLWVLLMLAGCAQAAVSTPSADLSQARRVAALLAPFEVAERPLPFEPDAIHAQAGLHFVTADETVDILIFEMENGRSFTDAVTRLAEQGIDVQAEAPYSFVGSNGSVLFVVRNAAPPAQQEETRWTVSAIASALAGEE